MLITFIVVFIVALVFFAELTKGNID